MSAAAAEILVKFCKVDKSYDGETFVVKNLDLNIYKGEFLTLLGPSGSGKTTCLMMLAGFEFPTHGEIWLADRMINRIPPHKRDIGVVFQNYALFPHMTVEENVAYPLTVRKIHKQEIADRVARVLEMVQMLPHKRRSPASLSGGQQQRIALARALVFDPPLILMDEPLGALDKQLREHMQIELKELHSKLNLTVVYVTHDQTEALTMSDRVAIFDAGRIQQVDRAMNLYESPCNLVVSNFVGDNNQFSGQVVSIADDMCEVILINDSRVCGVPVGAMVIGDKISACIRPERISVFPKDDRRAGNRFNACCESIIYHGDHVRVRCRLGPEDMTCFIKLPLDDPILSDLEVGANIVLGFSPSHLRIFA